jgi:hypothetical protein
MNKIFFHLHDCLALSCLRQTPLCWAVNQLSFDYDIISYKYHKTLIEMGIPIHLVKLLNGFYVDQEQLSAKVYVFAISQI